MELSYSSDPVTGYWRLKFRLVFGCMLAVALLLNWVTNYRFVAAYASGEDLGQPRCNLAIDISTGLALLVCVIFWVRRMRMKGWRQALWNDNKCDILAGLPNNPE